jgi:hypothetical protein
MTNEERADRAHKTLCFYIGLVSGDRVPLDEPDEACASDIVTDLMHLFGHDTMQTVFNRATNHYTYEIEEEEEEEDDESSAPAA